MRWVFLLITLLAGTAHSATNEPVIKDLGLFYPVPDSDPISQDMHFKIAFDVASGAPVGEQNNHINSLARFINMHVAHGVNPKNIALALVVHGDATQDVLKSSEYQARFAADNANASLIRQLLANNTQVYVCGQSAKHNNINAKQLLPGVRMALSAMTAHAQLQQQGYTLNPF